MFCSKCGKELDKGTAFCPSCGNPVNSVNQSASTGSPNAANHVSARSDISTEEKTKKVMACIAFLSRMVLDLILFWSIVGTKGTILLGGDFPEQRINLWWDTSGWPYIIIALFFTLTDLSNALKFYIITYFNRSFAQKKSKVIDNCFTHGIEMVIIPLSLTFFIYDEFGHFPVTLPVLGISICTINILVALTYVKAADYESYAILEANGSRV